MPTSTSLFYPPKRASMLCLAALLSILALFAAPLRAEQIKTIPVDVYRLVFDTDPKLDSQYQSREIERLIDRVNETWIPAGIRWDIGRITTVRVTRDDLLDGLPTERREFRRALAQIARRHFPEPAGHDRWQIALMHQFPLPASGIYVGEVGTVFYGELNKNGGAYPIILAHELGHSLGLNHVDQESNLMYGGKMKNPEKTLQLDPRQIDEAKAQAERGPAPPGAGGMERGAAGHRDRGGPPPEKRMEIVRRLRHFDRDGDGRIASTQVPPRARRAFGVIDQDGDGWIDGSEMKRFARGTPPPAQPSRDDFDW